MIHSSRWGLTPGEIHAVAGSPSKALDAGGQSPRRVLYGHVQRHNDDIYAEIRHLSGRLIIDRASRYNGGKRRRQVGIVHRPNRAVVGRLVGQSGNVELQGIAGTDRCRTRIGERESHEVTETVDSAGRASDFVMIDWTGAIVAGIVGRFRELNPDGATGGLDGQDRKVGHRAWWVAWRGHLDDVGQNRDVRVAVYGLDGSPNHLFRP